MIDKMRRRMDDKGAGGFRDDEGRMKKIKGK